MNTNTKQALINQPFIFWLVIFLIPFVLTSTKQDEPFSYLKYLNPEKIGIKQIEIDADSTKIERTYLGKLALSDSMHNISINYHVITEFRLILTATSQKGKSCLLFIDEKGYLVRQYNMDLPNELPTAIKHNLLLFGDRPLILSHLPDLLCMPNGACFE